MKYLFLYSLFSACFTFGSLTSAPISFLIKLTDNRQWQVIKLILKQKGKYGWDVRVDSIGLRVRNSLYFFFLSTLPFISSSFQHKNNFCCVLIQLFSVYFILITRRIWNFMTQLWVVWLSRAARWNEMEANEMEWTVSQLDGVLLTRYVKRF